MRLLRAALASLFLACFVIAAALGAGEGTEILLFDRTGHTLLGYGRVDGGVLRLELIGLDDTEDAPEFMVVIAASDGSVKTLSGQLDEAGRLLVTVDKKEPEPLEELLARDAVALEVYTVPSGFIADVGEEVPEQPAAAGERDEDEGVAGGGGAESTGPTEQPAAQRPGGRPAGEATAKEDAADDSGEVERATPAAAPAPGGRPEGDPPGSGAPPVKEPKAPDVSQGAAEDGTSGRRCPEPTDTVEDGDVAAAAEDGVPAKAGEPASRPPGDAPVNADGVPRKPGVARDQPRGQGAGQERRGAGQDGRTAGNEGSEAGEADGREQGEQRGSGNGGRDGAGQDGC